VSPKCKISRTVKNWPGSCDRGRCFTMNFQIVLHLRQALSMISSTRRNWSDLRYLAASLAISSYDSGSMLHPHGALITPFPAITLDRTGLTFNSLRGDSAALPQSSSRGPCFFQQCPFYGVCKVGVHWHFPPFVSLLLGSPTQSKV
jgi:hypothetical protein